MAAALAGEAWAAGPEGNSPGPGAFAAAAYNEAREPAGRPSAFAGWLGSRRPWGAGAAGSDPSILRAEAAGAGAASSACPRGTSSTTWSGCGLRSTWRAGGRKRSSSATGPAAVQRRRCWRRRHLAGRLAGSCSGPRTGSGSAAAGACDPGDSRAFLSGHGETGLALDRKIRDVDLVDWHWRSSRWRRWRTMGSMPICGRWGGRRWGHAGWTHSFLGVDGLPTTLTRMCRVGGASYGGLDWTGLDRSPHSCSHQGRTGCGGAGRRRAEGGGRKPKE